MRAIAVALLFLQAADYGAEGAKALDEGKYEAAAQAFLKAIAADPKDYTAHFNLGLAYSFLRKDAEGLAEYRKALELKSDLYEAQLNAGMLLMRLKEPGEAVPLFEAAVKQKPGEFQPRYYLAEAQRQAGTLDKAEENYRQALAIDAKSAGAELGLAQTLARQGKIADADPHYRQAVRLDSAYRDSLLELAGYYDTNKQSAEAIAIYREFPDNSAAQKRLGELMLESRQYSDAIPRLETAYAKDPSQSNRTALAMAYIHTGMLDQALPLLEKAVAAEGSDYELRMAYGRALRDRKQYAPAAAQFAEAARQKPNEPKTFNELGSVLYMIGDFPRSLAAFDRARELGDNTAGNWFLRAIILDKLKQLKPALDAYQRFLSLSQGKNPDQEFQARQRARIIQRELEKR